jgi:ferredoxin-NADP reductase
MARAALPRRLSWQLARVIERVEETPRCKSIVLEAPAWPGHLAGQHVDVRLTAEDGYQAQRSYSIASGPEDANLVLTVERLEDGEVSPYLVDELTSGDQLELRGPIGGYFVWEPSSGGPLMLIAGGSGIVPFRAMLRHRMASGADVGFRLLYSARSLDDVIYREELLGLAGNDELDTRITLTREWPPGWRGYRGRITSELLRDASWPAASRPLIYACGPSGFVEAIADALVQAGHEPKRIRTERFGPTGG